MTESLWALKEWAIAVQALGAGDLILLVRKGGIHESRRSFNMPCDRALLFPTYEHQQASALRSPFQSAMTPQAVPALGDGMSLQYWAEITHQLPLAEQGIVEALQPFHIWTDDWLVERLAWKPERPTYALLLQVHRLVTPVDVPIKLATRAVVRGLSCRMKALNSLTVSRSYLTRNIIIRWLRFKRRSRPDR
ncbi:MAG: DUF1802 family protein [Cyanobacteria bacterium P01_H01_bin.162]